ncbi:hypothetical protein HK099_008534 [Clydaea vesicula]|uniref:Uncharacterized protein n=1 Tax=Clydaea vesicula TaxID=447962 RepID=A0AAD5U627_9FUNG|nr:hypothetical protein HK099_008534 [Clydaea vesicula]
MESEEESQWNINNIPKRIMILNYLKNVSSTKTNWLGTMKIPFSELSMCYEAEKFKKRTSQLFLLGTSIGLLLRIKDSNEFAKSLVILMQEFEQETKEKNSRQRIFSRSKRSSTSDLSLMEKENYVYLQPIKHVYFVITFSTFCEILSQTYEKLLKTSDSQLIFDLSKFDARIKKIVNVMIKEIDAIARKLIKEELYTIE